jgi:NitT/TauT family transport system ATP-binding protein
MGFALSVQDLGKDYVHPDGSRHPVLQDIAFSAKAPEVIAVMGRSGVGKSTLLNMVAGTLKPDRGVALIDGAAMEPCGFMQQTPQLLPYRTALQNACLGLELRGELQPPAIDHVRALLAEFGLGRFLDHYPAQLSGGMQQRVAFARTLATGARILLCDEPFSAIDFETRLELETLFRRHIISSGRIALVATHDIDTAVSIADRVIVLGGAPAGIIGTVAIEGRHDTLAVLTRDEPVFLTHAAAVWKTLSRHA